MKKPKMSAAEQKAEWNMKSQARINRQPIRQLAGTKDGKPLWKEEGEGVNPCTQGSLRKGTDFPPVPPPYRILTDLGWVKIPTREAEEAWYILHPK